MGIRRNVFIGKFYFKLKLFYFNFEKYFHREFFLFFKKIGIIMIVSFANTGSGETLYLNNGFFILILTSFHFWIQIQWEPFITKELNSLDLQSSLIVILTIFGALFCSVCQDLTLQNILMDLIILINVYFLGLFLKAYLQIKLTFAKNSKLINFFNKYFAEKFWKKGPLFILI